MIWQDKFHILKFFTLVLTVGIFNPLASQTIPPEIQEMIRKEMQRKGGETPASVQAEGDTIPQETPAVTQIPVPKREVAVQEGLNYFGYDFFRAPGVLSIWDNLPVPGDYTLGPGDELVITLWGETQIRSSHLINRDGNILVDKVGQLSLAGMNLEEAEKYLKSYFERVYATLKSPNQRTYMDVTLGKLKSINVKFVGEVAMPGIYPIHPFSTVTTGLIQAGGVKTTGSLRDIQVISGSKVIARVDLYAFLLKGQTDGDIRLQNDMVVFVPVRYSTVQIRGEIHRPAIYETKPEESLETLLAYAGGHLPTAGTKVEVHRVIPLSSRNSDDVAREVVTTDIQKTNPFPLMDGDEVILHQIHDVQRTVTIEGQVKKPGIYSLSVGMQMRDLLDLAGGIFDEEFWQTVYPFRADMVRTYERGTRSEIIPIKLDALRSGDQSQNLALQHADRLIVYPLDVNLYQKVVSIFGEVRNPGTYTLDQNMGLSDLVLRAGGLNYSAYPREIEVVRVDPFSISSEKLVTVLKSELPEGVFKSFPTLDNFELQDHDQVVVRRFPKFQFQRNVAITGEVKFPGVYALRSEKETLGDLIKRCGGFTEEAFEEGITVVRNGVRVVIRNYKVLLVADDNVYVPKAPGVVRVMGEVYNPGLIHYIKGKSLKDYIVIAGGFTDDANRGNVLVMYASGDVKKRGVFRDPKVKEGTTVVVHRAKEKEPFDSTEFLKETASIVASLATIFYIVSQSK